MKTKSTLVRSDCTVKLYTETSIYMSLSVVIYPRYTECNNTLWLCHSFKQSIFAVLLLICLNYRTKGIKNFLNCLLKLFLAWILLCNLLQHFIYVRHYDLSICRSGATSYNIQLYFSDIGVNADFHSTLPAHPKPRDVKCTDVDRVDFCYRL